MAYFLRTTDRKGKSYGDFQWPMEVGATVTCPDWNHQPACGGGLHGLLNGEGTQFLLGEKDDPWWIVEAEDAVYIKGKYKFQTCKVVAFGDCEEICMKMYDLTGGACPYITLTGGDMSTLTGGNRSILKGGIRSTLTGGDKSTLTGGDGSTLTGGYMSTLTGGDGSTIKGGNWSTLTGGDESILTGGFKSTLTGGDESALLFSDDSLFAVVGEAGIKPDTPYHVVVGKIVENN